MSRKFEGYYVDEQMITLKKGDEYRLNFPTRPNWLYQIALQARYRNTKTGKVLQVGKPFGSHDKNSTTYAYSERSSTFNQKVYKRLLEDAKTSGYNYCAGRQYGEETDTNKYEEDEWRHWRIDEKSIKVHLIIWRQLKEPSGIKIPRAAKKDIKSMLKPRKLTKKVKAELEKQYPTPQKYVKAQKALRRKIQAQKSRAFKRKKSK